MRLPAIPVLIAVVWLTLPSPAEQKPKKTPPPSARSEAPATKSEVLRPLNEQEKAQQMLNRFTFGARPGDLESVMKLGPDAWFEQQLTPEKIPDDALNRRLADYPVLNLPPGGIATALPYEGLIRQVELGHQPIPPDPVEHGLYEVLLYKYRLKQELKAQRTPLAPAQTPPNAMEAQSSAMATPQAPAAQSSDQSPAAPAEPSASQLADQLLALPKEKRMLALMKMPIESRIAVATNVQDPQKHMLLNEFTPHDREIFAAMASGQDAMRVVDEEFQQAKILRAILSERQLQEVMTDFWFNHFNVFLNKDYDRFYTPSYERDAIRAHALGKFRDLLLATAQHPAMLVYLDNWQSMGPDSFAAERAKQRNVERGLNENYGREVMELHTVGVDGGYTQADVTNLAKILTGWTIDQPQFGGPFMFDPRRHQPGTKPWFGQNIKQDGYNEGARALAWLAAQPQTAHFISYKLAQRFVADDPPPALVDRMAKTFLASDGDIKQVLRTMVHSPEFFSQTYYRNKVKTPLEFVASAFRATGTNPVNPTVLIGTLRNMGEPLYQMQPPTGYPMTEEHWMNSTALIDRLNFSLSLTSSHLGNTPFDAPRLIAAGLLARPGTANGLLKNTHTLPIVESRAATPSGEDEALGLIEQTLLGQPASLKTNSVIRKQIADHQQPAPDAGKTLSTMAALVLGSPEFQMR